MLKTITLIIFSILIAGCATVAPSNKPECNAVRISDGTSVTLDSVCWENIPSYQLGSVPQYINREPLTIQFAYDKNNLYMRFEKKDDDIVDEFPQNPKPASGMFLYADAVELFLSTPGSRGYWEFHFIPSGQCGGIYFPSRGRRMPSNVRYLPFPCLKYHVKLNGTLNNRFDRDSGWLGVAVIPLKGIEKGCKPFDPAKGLLVQVTSIAYSVYSEWDDRSQLNYIQGKPTDPHYLPAWVNLNFR